MGIRNPYSLTANFANFTNGIRRDLFVKFVKFAVE